MEGTQQSQVGRDIVGQPVQEGSFFSEQSAHIHRDLAIGNFFVTLRHVAGVAGKLLDHVLKQEQERR